MRTVFSFFKAYWIPTVLFIGITLAFTIGVQVNRTPADDGVVNLADSIFAWAIDWAPFFGMMLTFAIVAAAFMTISQTRLFRKQDTEKGVAAEIVHWTDEATPFLEKVIGPSDSSVTFLWIEELLDILLHLQSLMGRSGDGQLLRLGQSTRDALLKLFDPGSAGLGLSVPVAEAKVKVMELRRQAIARR